MPTLSIGKIAKATDVKVPTIRFYEEIGLLNTPDRTESDRRIYDEDAVRRLAFIKHSRDLGFSVDAIRVLLDLADHPERPCDEANALASAQLEDVERKIERLQALKAELERMVESACAGRVADCKVIESLADHSNCQHHGRSGAD
jgi:DNA-binding transcriptional MerR regulator